MSELNLYQQDAGDWHILRLDGYVDAHTFIDFEEALTHLVEQGKYRIKLDMEQLTYISSTGLGLLIATYRQVRQQGGDLVVENLSPKLSNIFNLLGFSCLMDGEEPGEAGTAA